MSSLATFEYQLPEFVTINGYDPVGLFECVKETSSTFPNGKNRILEVAKSFPWIRQLLPPANSVISTQSIKAESVSKAGRSFRRVGWHTDRMEINDGSFDEKIGLLSTSTPTTFASCKIIMDTTLAKKVGIYGQPASLDNMASLDPKWLEQALGIVPTPPIEESWEIPITDIVKEVLNFRAVQADPGVFAKGDVEQTLHTASVVMDGDPLDRVIIGIRHISR